LEDLLELDGQDLGVDSGTSQGEPESIANPSQSRQPAKVNLDELEDFRKWKSAADKRDQANQQTIRTLQQQTDAYNARLRAVEMEGLDDVGKVAYENRELKRILQERTEDENRRYAEWQWKNLMEEVSRETGIPEEELEDAKDSNDLWRLGRKYERTNGKVQGDGTRTTDNRVAIGGGGKTGSVESRIREEYRRAKEDNNYSAMNAAKEKAYKAGIDPESLRR
jgi:hypothetical protein